MSPNRKIKNNAPKDSDTDPVDDQINQKTSSNANYRTLALQVLESVLLHELALGNITIAEITDGTFSDKITEMYSEVDCFVPVIDYTQSILRKARKERSRSPEEAVLHYALYIEHKINAWISVLSARKKIDQSAALGLMRELKLKSKATWALQLLDVEPLAPDIVKKIEQLSEIRNAYAHYKWVEKLDDTIRKENFQNLFAAAEDIVSAIVLHENKIFYGRGRRIIRNMLFKNRIGPATVAAMEEAQRGAEARFNSVDALMADLQADD